MDSYLHSLIAMHYQDTAIFSRGLLRWHRPNKHSAQLTGGCKSRAHSLVSIIIHFFSISCSNNKKDGYRQLNVRQLGSIRPWEHRGKCYMDRKRIQCLSNASQHVARYWSEIATFSYLLAFNARPRTECPL